LPQAKKEIDMTEPQYICDETVDQAAGLLKALADPNRLRIFDLLMQGDSCNCELNSRLGLLPNLLSHHLSVLRKAGLINSRRDMVDGRWIYYTVNRAAVARWQSWFTRFLDPAQIQTRATLCGPEGQQAGMEPVYLVIDHDTK
jgi:ArsR family transcriptional regulator, arsenate/arsenite/antimonite-responsive transcriptional repressor